MINYDSLKQYCSGNPLEIANIEAACADTVNTWHLHHRAEIDDHKKRSELIAEGKYYGRPPAELIFLPPDEHMRLHMKTTQQNLKEFRDKLEAETGYRLTQEHREKISQGTSGENNPMYGRRQSEETRKKISDARKELIKAGLIKTRSGCHLSDETKAVLSEKAKERLADKTKHPMYGRHQSEEAKKKIAAKKKGKVWANDGVRTRLVFPNELPEGWSLGRLM